MAKQLYYVEAWQTLITVGEVYADSKGEAEQIILDEPEKAESLRNNLERIDYGTSKIHLIKH